MKYMTMQEVSELRGLMAAKRDEIGHKTRVLKMNVTRKEAEELRKEIAECEKFLRDAQKAINHFFAAGRAA